MGEDTMGGLVALAALGLGCAAVFVVARMGGRGTLRRNAWAGIRTTTTMTDDETWWAAHRAGAIPMMVGSGVGLVLTLTGGAMALAGVEPFGVAVITAVAPLLVGVAVGGLQGQRAAREVLDSRGS